MNFSWIKGTSGNDKKPYYWKKILERLKDNEIILDFGAADCKFFDFLKENKISFKGYTYDLDIESYKISKKKGYFPLKQFSNLKNKFDSIIFLDVIEHMGFSDFLKLIGQFKKSLKQKGKLFIGTSNITPSNIWNFFDDLTHIRPYPAKPLETFLKSEGFKCELCYLEKTKNPFKALMNYLFKSKNYSYYLLVCDLKK